MRTRDKAGGQRRPLRTLLHGATLLLALCAFTAPAGAAVIGATQKCFVNSHPARSTTVSVIGNGFGAGDTVLIFGGKDPVTTVASADGTIAATIPVPVLNTTGAAEHTYTLTAQDETDNVTSAATTATVANLAVDTVPPQNVPSTERVLWQLSGFRPNRTIWVHYFYRRHLVTQLELGRATGACGMLGSRHLLYPGGHPHHSTYGVVIDQSKRYHRSSRPRIVSSLSFHVLA